MNSSFCTATKSGPTRSTPCIDIFRVDDAGKIIEHWDVLQTIPDHSEHDNGMF